MTRAERLRDRTVFALIGTALAASVTVVAVLLLFALFDPGGMPPDLVSEVLFVSVVVAVVSSVFAIPFALFALRNRDDAVDEVFLVHQSGLLLVHLSKSLKAEKDRDVLVGMLTAVQSFILEAFAKGPSRELRQMDFGKRKILLRKGSHCYLAVIVRGRRPAVFTHRMRRALGAVEGAYWRVIGAWDGSSVGLEGADDLLRRELMDGSLRVLAQDVIDAAVDGVTSRLVSWWQRRRAPNQAKAKSDVRSPRERAAELLDRPEARDAQASYHDLILTALEQVEEGRFTLAGATNVYLALALQRSPRSSVAGWWDEVLLTVRDVLRTWPWDPVTQAWVEARSPRTVAESTAAQLDEVPAAPLALQTDQAPLRRSIPTSRRN
jgi:hypothetical protein